MDGLKGCDCRKGGCMRGFGCGLARVLGISLAVMFGVSGCSGSKTDVVEAIRQTGALRVALVNTDSGFTSLEGEKPVGTEPELAAFIAENLGVTAQFQVCSREEAMEALAGNHADIAMGCFGRSESYEQGYETSGVYGKGFCYVVTKKGDYVGTIGGLKQRSVGVDRNLNEATKGLLYSAEGVSLMDFSDGETAAKALNDDTIQAYVCYEKQAKVLLENEGFQVQNLMNLEPEEYVLVVPAGSDELMNGINVLIRQFLESQ